MENLNLYIIKAIDAYPYNLEVVCESLQYALSYDNKNPLVYILMGQVAADHLDQKKLAIQYFEEALSLDTTLSQAQSYLIRLFTEDEEFEKAERLLNYAMLLKGSDKDMLYFRKVQLLEKQKKWKEAKKILKEMKFEVCHDHYKLWMDQTTARLTAKLKK